MRQRLFTSIILAVLPLAVACGGKEPGPVSETAGPKLVSATPADGSTDINYEGGLTIRFTYDQNVKCLTADQSAITIDNQAQVVKVFAYAAELTVTVEGLKDGTKYCLTIPEGTVKGFKDKQKASEAVEYHFTTKTAPLPPEPEVIPEKGDNIAWQMAARLGLGWNMGNHMDSFDMSTMMPSETLWGNPLCTQATMDRVRAVGFKTVRIPITWCAKIGPAPDYKIDAAWLERVATIVEYAHKADLNVIINTHHDEDHYIGNEKYGHRWLNVQGAAKDENINKQVIDEITKFWTQVAERFISCGDWLIFESFNEINDGGWGYSQEFLANPSAQCNVLNEWNQAFVDAVRATGSNNATRWLGVPTYAASPTYTKYFVMPNDPAGKTMLGVHCYDPGSFTIGDEQYGQWGHTATSDKDPYHDERALRSTMSSLYNNYVNKGIPVYLGEFGCSMRDKSNSTRWKFYKYYLEYFVKAAKTYGMPCFLWDNGATGAGKEHHPYIDHGTGKFIGNAEEVVNVMVKAMTDESASYTLQSVYDSAPLP